MAVTTSQVQQLYIAYFNRPADFFGLTFQTAQANQFGLQFVADQFSKSPEYIATYAGKETGDIINTIYMNLFGRLAEPSGMKFWGDLLSDPKSGITIGNAAITIANGAINADKVSVANKLIAANAFYASLDTSAEMAGYSGAAANQVLKTWLTTITDQASLDAAITPAALLVVSTAAIAAHDGAININTALTAGTDAFVGTAARDTITAVIDVAGSTSTLTALDSIDGGAGIDTLIINNLDGSAIPAGVTIANVENISVRAAGNLVLSSKTFAGVTSLKSTQSIDATLTAGSATAVEVSGATGNVVVIGGSTQTVTSTGANTGIDLSAGAGAITATHKAQGTALIDIDDGTSVTVVAEGRSTGAIQIGAAGAATAPTGAVNVTATGKASGATAALGTITITGGSTVSVKEVATSDATNALTDTTGATITQGAISVTGTSKTTSVTVVQSAEVAVDPAVVTVASAKETQTVTFGAMTAGQTLVINGLTFTASKALTATEVATAFANLGTSSVQGSAPAGNGIYSGTSNTLSFSTGPVVTVGTTKTVTFTSSASNGNLALVTIGGSATGTSAAGVTDGAVGVAGYDGTLGVAAGQVTINGAITGADVLTTVSLDSYANGSTVASDALTSLALANSSHSLAITNAAATTLALALNNVGDNVAGSAAAINLGATYTTLNITADVASSRAALAAGGVQALTVAGTKSVNFTGSAMAALKTVTVTGAAGVTIDASGANVTAVDTSATTGSSTVTIDTANATFVGGAGTDSVTLSSTTTTKAVTLGAGNDTLNLAAGTTTLTAVMDGGVGTDTLKMAAADAAAASLTGSFATKFTGFEKLSLGASVSGVTNTVDLSNMNNINYVISAGSSLTAPVVPTAVVTQGGVAAEATTYTFSAGLAVGESFTVDGVTVTNTGVAAQTAASVASVFAGTVVAGLTSSGTFATPATWTGAPVASVSGAALTLTNTVAGNVTDFTTAATSGGAAGTGAIVLTKMADAGTLELTGAGSSATVTMLDATGTTDSFNIVTKLSTAAINYGTVAVAGVETINLTVTDTAPTSASGSASIQTATLSLTDAALKSVIVTGNANLVLTQTAAALTSVDGSAMTGTLTAGTNGTVSQTIKGGGAADVLTANGNADTLIGGAGADKLIVGTNADLTTLTGGAGSDTFDVSLATTNVNSYATITDLAAGDKIQFAALGATFNASKVSLSDTAVFQDYANAAINATTTGDISWFQFGGNTYVIENIAHGTSFLNGTDVIVKIVGAVDLSTASYSSSADTLLITV